MKSSNGNRPLSNYVADITFAKSDMGEADLLYNMTNIH